MSTFLGEKNKAEYEAELRTAIAETNDSFRRAAMKGIKSTGRESRQNAGRCLRSAASQIYSFKHRSQPSTRSPKITTHTVNTTLGVSNLTDARKCSGKSTTTQIPAWNTGQTINSTRIVFWSLCSQTSTKRTGEVTNPRLHFTKEKDSDTGTRFRKNIRSCDLLRLRFTKYQRHRTNFRCQYPDSPTLAERQGMGDRPGAM